jgi:hypothetical protein
MLAACGVLGHKIFFAGNIAMRHGRINTGVPLRDRE